MATQAHCAFCFESLVARFENRQALSLSQVEALWQQHVNSRSGAGGPENDRDDGKDEDGADDRMDQDTIAGSLSKTSSSSSLPPARSTASSISTKDSASSSTTSISSRASSSSVRHQKRSTHEEHPLFVTWNTISRSGHKSLRGCIGTFGPLELEDGLRSYAYTSAFEDHRFSPIPQSLLPSLSNHVTLLTNFSVPTEDPMDWTLGTHGLRISFTHHRRRYSATYLPDVAKEQGWTKEETLLSLMKKAGWNGSSSQWLKVWREGRGEIVRYEGKQVGLDYAAWKEWRDWVEQPGPSIKASE